LIVYVDASALAKRYLREPGDALVEEVWAHSLPALTSVVTIVEVRSALASARRSRRLSRTAATAAGRLLEADWERVAQIFVDGVVADAAQALVARHRLRSMDAIHLATASLFRAACPLLLTFDDRLARAARAEGLAVAGAG
jgi:hypothetical protein